MVSNLVKFLFTGLGKTRAKQNAWRTMFLTRWFNSECFDFSVCFVTTIKFGIVGLDSRMSKCFLKVFLWCPTDNLGRRVVFCELSFACWLDLSHSFSWSDLYDSVPWRRWWSSSSEQSGNVGKVNPISFILSTRNQSVTVLVTRISWSIWLESTTRPRICIFERTTRISLSPQIPRRQHRLPRAPCEDLQRDGQNTFSPCVGSATEPQTSFGVCSYEGGLGFSIPCWLKATKCSTKSCPAPASFVLQTCSPKMTACWPGRTAGQSLLAGSAVSCTSIRGWSISMAEALWSSLCGWAMWPRRFGSTAWLRTLSRERRWSWREGSDLASVSIRDTLKMSFP